MSLSLREANKLADKIQSFRSEIIKIRVALRGGTAYDELCAMCDRLEADVESAERELRSKKT